MANYKRDPRCSCARCRLCGIMGPVVLITFGLLMLLNEFGVRHFHDTWPLLLIVIGIVKVLQYTAPTENHIGYAQPQPYVTPPPAAPGGEMPQNTSGSGNEGVQNG